MFKNNNIRKNVLLVIESRIESAQKEYDDTVKTIDEATELAIKDLKSQAQDEKENLSVSLVKKVLGSILN